MTIAKRVRHLGNDHAQNIMFIVAEPKGHGVEHMAQDAGLGQKVDAGRDRQAMGCQHLPHPRGASAMRRCAAMILIPDSHQIGAVAGKQTRSFGGFWCQQHIIDRIAKAVLHRAFPAMKCLARDMIDRAHAASRSATQAAMASATSTAEAKPSS